MFTQGHVIDRRYRVRSALGEGSGGQVYEVQDLKAGTVLALKIQQPRFLESTLAYRSYRREVRREVRLGKSLSAVKGVVIPLDFGSYLDRVYFVMDRIEGSDLEDFTAREQPVSSVRSAAAVAQLSAILDDLHSHGYVHRDIKPDNAMLSIKGEVRLLDLGSIARIGEVPRYPAGTPGYLPPEALDRPRAEASLDVFALGCSMFRMLTMEPPFPNETGRPPRRRRLPIELLQHVDPVVRSICVAMLEWEPGNRATAAEVRDELTAVLPDALAPAPRRQNPDPVHWWWESLHRQEHTPVSS
ncbi:MAG: serine/threonine protein kinase [Actinomycetota bacterium]|nr:serine/threonine protein kinase [Actinomycetota bacterium]